MWATPTGLPYKLLTFWRCWVAQLANFMYTIKYQVGTHTVGSRAYLLDRHWVIGGVALPFEKYFNAVATSWCNTEGYIIKNETCLSLLLLIIICEFHFVVVVNLDFFG